MQVGNAACVTALDHVRSSQTAFLKFGSSCIIHHALIIYLGGVLSFTSKSCAACHWGRGASPCSVLV